MSIMLQSCHPCPAAGAVCLLQGFNRGPDCTASPVCDERALKPGKSNRSKAGYNGFTEYLPFGLHLLYIFFNLNSQHLWPQDGTYYVILALSDV